MEDILPASKPKFDWIVYSQSTWGDFALDKFRHWEFLPNFSGAEFILQKILFLMYFPMGFGKNPPNFFGVKFVPAKFESPKANKFTQVSNCFTFESLEKGRLHTKELFDPICK